MLGAAWMVAAVFMLSNSPTPLYEHWRQQMGFSAGTLTVIFSAYIAGLLGTLLFAGQLSDRYGRKPLLLPGLLAALIASLLFASASSVMTLGLARFLTGIAVGVIVTAGMASVTDLGGGERRRLAALLASIAMVFGAGLGPLLAGGLAQAMPQQPTVAVFGVTLLVLASALLTACVLPLHRPASAGRTALRIRLPSVPTANRRHLALGISIFGPGITATSFVLALGPSLLSRLLNIHSPLVAGSMACAMFLTATGVQFVMRQRSVRTILLSGAAATALAMLFLAIAINATLAPALIVAALLAGAGQGLGQLGGLTLIGMNVPGTRQAEANAVLNIGGYVPAGLLPVATGYLIDSLGIVVAATLFAGLLMFAATAGGMFVRRSISH